MNNRIKSNKHMTYVLRIDKFPILKYEVKTNKGNDTLF